MEIIQIVGLGLVAALLAIVLKEQKPVFAFLITVFAGVLIFFSWWERLLMLSVFLSGWRLKAGSISFI